jgi:putative DNA primase/helicase
MHKVQQKPNGLLAELKALPNWLLWKLEERRDGESTKVPYSTKGTLASSTNRRTWASYAAVSRVADQ